MFHCKLMFNRQLLQKFTKWILRASNSEHQLNSTLSLTSEMIFYRSRYSSNTLMAWSSDLNYLRCCWERQWWAARAACWLSSDRALNRLISRYRGYHALDANTAQRRLVNERWMLQFVVDELFHQSSCHCYSIVRNFACVDGSCWY